MRISLLYCMVGFAGLVIERLEESVRCGDQDMSSVFLVVEPSKIIFLT